MPRVGSAFSLVLKACALRNPPPQSAWREVNTIRIRRLYAETGERCVAFRDPRVKACGPRVDAGTLGPRGRGTVPGPSRSRATPPGPRAHVSTRTLAARAETFRAYLMRLRDGGVFRSMPGFKVEGRAVVPVDFIAAADLGNIVHLVALRNIYGSLWRRHVGKDVGDPHPVAGRVNGFEIRVAPIFRMTERLGRLKRVSDRALGELGVNMLPHAQSQRTLYWLVTPMLAK